MGRGNESKYLLSGFARCSVCGGGRNGLALPMTRVDEAVLSVLAGDALRPAIVMGKLDGVLGALSPQTLERDVEQLRSQQADVERELARLSNAIAAGGELSPLLEALKARQIRRDEITRAIAARESFDVRRFDRKAIEAKVNEYVNGWRAPLTKHVAEGRQLLREVLANCSGVPNWTPSDRQPSCVFASRRSGSMKRPNSN